MIRAVLLGAALVRAAGAQQPELRVDTRWTREVVAYAGAGLTWPAGNYARLSAVGALAIDGPDRGTPRADVFARVSLDPFRRRRAGFSFGGGITVDRSAYLLAVAELEGPVRGGLSPAVQVGLGGGYRVSLVLRRSAPGRR